MINKQDLEAIQICRTVAQIAIERGEVYPGLTAKVGMAIVRLRILIEQEAKRYDDHG